MPKRKLTAREVAQRTGISLKRARELTAERAVVKYPVEERGASYQRYLAKLRRRSKWKRRVRRPKRVALAVKAPVLIVEKKTGRILVEKPVSDAVIVHRLGISEKKLRKITAPLPTSPKRVTMKEVATMRRALGISPSKARRLLREAQRTAQPEYRPKKKKKIWLPKTIRKSQKKYFK